MVAARRQQCWWQQQRKRRPNTKSSTKSFAISSHVNPFELHAHKLASFFVVFCSNGFVCRTEEVQQRPNPNLNYKSQSQSQSVSHEMDTQEICALHIYNLIDPIRLHLSSTCYFMKFFEHNQCEPTLCNRCVCDFFSDAFSSCVSFSVFVSVVCVCFFYSSHQFLRPPFSIAGTAFSYMIGTIVHNKIAKLFHRRINCTLLSQCVCV